MKRLDKPAIFSYLSMIQYTKQIGTRKKQFGKTMEDIRTRNKEMEKNPGFEIVLRGRIFTEHKKAGELLRAILDNTGLYEEVDIGTYKDFELALKKNSFEEKIVIKETVLIQWKSKRTILETWFA